MAYTSGIKAADYGSPTMLGYEAITADVNASQAHLRAGHWHSANECLRLALGAITDLQSQLLLAQEQQELQARIEKESANGN